MVIQERARPAATLSPCIIMATKPTARAFQVCRAAGEVVPCSLALVAAPVADSDTSNLLSARPEVTISTVCTGSCQRVTMKTQTAMTRSQRTTESSRST